MGPGQLGRNLLPASVASARRLVPAASAGRVTARGAAASATPARPRRCAVAWGGLPRRAIARRRLTGCAVAGALPHDRRGDPDVLRAILRAILRTIRPAAVVLPAAIIVSWGVLELLSRLVLA